jgi:hypothetical protein
MEDRKDKVHSSFEFDFVYERRTVVTGTPVTTESRKG